MEASMHQVSGRHPPGAHAATTECQNRPPVYPEASAAWMREGVAILAIEQPAATSLAPTGDRSGVGDDQGDGRVPGAGVTRPGTAPPVGIRSADSSPARA